MKDKLSCVRCREIVCTDLDVGERAIGNLRQNNAIRFPQNVRDCNIRREIMKLEEIADNLRGQVWEVEQDGNEYSYISRRTGLRFRMRRGGE